MFDANYGRPWTADEIGERLKQAFRSTLAPGAPSTASARRHFMDASGRAIRSSEWIKQAQLILGRTQDTEMLFAWARSQAGIGPSLRETCRIKGWWLSTVERRRMGGVGQSRGGVFEKRTVAEDFDRMKLVHYFDFLPWTIRTRTALSASSS